MALVQGAVEASIGTAFQAQYGVADDPIEFAKFKTALASALIDILQNQAAVSTTGATAVGTPGGPLAITAQPGVIL